MADLRGFVVPDRYRRWADALLGGLTHAQRVGEGIRVPDPRDPEGADLVVPVPPAVGPAKAAEQLFGKHRRGLRGLRRATERLEALELRGRELAVLEQRFAAPDCTEEQCIAEMRRLRLPVALEPDTRAGRAASTTAACSSPNKINSASEREPMAPSSTAVSRGLRCTSTSPALAAPKCTAVYS